MKPPIPLDRIEALPIWRGAVQATPLKGGLSNESFVVTDCVATYVVRFGCDYPFHHVLREREVMTARAAHAAGFAPEVIYAAPGVMVSRFIEGRTFDASDVQSNLRPIARLIRRFHDEMPRHISGIGFMFWVFHVIRDYARTLAASKSPWRDRLPDFVALAEEMENIQRAAPLPIVFGHNDLLPANFIDDGTRLWLIDFEYAGFSTAMFDLAGVASNAGLDAEAASALLTIYFDHTPDEALLRAHAAMQCASLLREAMWSMVSDLYLTAPGADYDTYARDNLAALDRALDTYRTRFGKA